MGCDAMRMRMRTSRCCIDESEKTVVGRRLGEGGQGYRVMGRWTDKWEMRKDEYYEHTDSLLEGLLTPIALMTMFSVK